ncbi:hypothetical protein K7X08_033748 [Anisodus acutangulus]|uniref:Uncharacterized protein n=1 Tax=Anisodus acutangulus TaxID=402998 RepID=A0A9Q1M4R3_9SOLA|nr:hypothetical protein K7X08_033748 [Anisodus acutangulus]
MKSFGNWKSTKWYYYSYENNEIQVEGPFSVFSSSLYQKIVEGKGNYFQNEVLGGGQITKVTFLINLP